MSTVNRPAVRMLPPLPAPTALPRGGAARAPTPGDVFLSARPRLPEPALKAPPFKAAPMASAAPEALWGRAALAARPGEREPIVDLIVPPAGLEPGASDAVRGGQDVARLQDCLVALGYLSAADVGGGKGNYGPRTQAAVGRFQRDQGIDNTGAVGRFGPKTHAALASAIAQVQQPKLQAVIQNAYQDVLGHPPAEGDFLVARAHQALGQGKWLSEIDGYLRTELKATDEYRSNHLDEVVRDTYRDVLLRDADPGGMETWLEVANDLKAEGKSASEISRTLGDHFRASAEYAQLPPGVWQKVPYVNQYDPAGREQGYTNGPSNCGPTSMAMLARAVGYRPELADAQLINHLGRIGGTTVEGTSWNGIVAMADAMGKGAVTHPGKDPGVVGWVRDQLRAGKAVVANGNLYAMQPHANPEKSSGHYVLVTGMDKEGNFLVEDPADRNVRSVPPENLREFFRTHAWGGGAIAIG